MNYEVSPKPIEPESSGLWKSLVWLALIAGVCFLLIPLFRGDFGESTGQYKQLERPHTLISRNAVYISEAITADRDEQEDIDDAFDSFASRSNGLSLDVISLWDYQYLIVTKLESRTYDLFFSNSLPAWRTDQETKRQRMIIYGPLFLVIIRQPEKSLVPREARMVKKGVDLTFITESIKQRGWMRYIATNDFRINSYGTKNERKDRVATADFFGGKYPFGKKTIYTEVIP